MTAGEDAVNVPLSNCIVREATLEDCASMTSLFDELDYDVEEQDVAAGLEGLSRYPADRVFVAAVDGDVAGLITFHRTPLLHDPFGLGRITALVVGERYRGRGVGGLLVAEVERYASTVPCRRIEVSSREYRQAAHRFYRNRGYEDDDRRFLKHLEPAVAPVAG